MENIKHYLASALTNEKFVSKFEHLNPYSDKSFTFILKGTSGSGKSTLLKKISKKFSSYGYAIEQFHCSSDVESLDGVRIKEKEIAIIDGTFPHSEDTKYPLLCDKIINLTDCIEEGVKEKKSEMLKLYSQKSKYLSNAYLLLQSAGFLHKSNLSLMKKEDDYKTIANRIFNDFNIEKFEKVGNKRNLFFSYFLDKKQCLIDKNRFNCFELKNDDYSNSQVLKQLSKLFIDNGYNVIEFNELLCQTELESILIEDLNLLIVKRNSQSLENEILNNLSMLYEIEKIVCNSLKKARDIHKEIESYYLEYVDFDKLNIITDNLMAKIEEL